MRWHLWGVPLVLGLSCGGTSITGAEGDDDGGTGARGPTPGAGGSVGSGGAVGKGGYPGKGGTSAGKGGTSTGKGGFSGKGGSAGRGGSAGKGGTVGKGGTSGAGGEGPPGGEGPGGTGTECHYTPIGTGRRCENAGSRAQDDASVLVDGATTLAACARACSEREDCTAITDYLSEPAFDACYLRHGTCNVVAVTNYSEEDAGKEYRKVCDANGGCWLQYLGDWQRCTDAGATLERLAGAASQTDCFNACLDVSTCTSVTDYFWISTIVGCYLYTSTCNSPELLPPGDSGVTYRKVCD